MGRPACDHEWTTDGEQVWDRVCRRCVISQREARICELEAKVARVWAVLDAAGGEVLTCEVADAMDPTTEGS